MRFSIPLALTLIAVSVARADSPTPVRRLAFTTLNTTFYIQAGFANGQAVGQLFALDLSAEWDTTNPAWTRLSTGTTGSDLSMAAISAVQSGTNGGTLVTFGGGSNSSVFVNTYDIASDTWKAQPKAIIQYPQLLGTTAITNPDTGTIYVGGGFFNNTGRISYNRMSVYNGGSFIGSTNATATNTVAEAGAVWSTVRKSVLYFGGANYALDVNNGLGGSANLNEYVPTTPVNGSWGTMATTGTRPAARLDHCMAASPDGSKVVVFGGADNKNYFSDIFILDVASGVWTAGTSASDPRTRMSCTLYNDFFIAFGGSSGDLIATLHDNTPIVYDLQKNTWVTHYTPNRKSGSATSVGGIIGGVIAVAALAAVGALYLIRKRKRQQQQNEVDKANALAAAMMVGEEGSSYNKYNNGSLHGASNSYAMGHMDKMEINDAHAMEAARQRMKGESSYNDAGGYGDSDTSTLVQTDQNAYNKSVAEYTSVFSSQSNLLAPSPHPVFIGQAYGRGSPGPQQLEYSQQNALLDQSYLLSPHSQISTALGTTASPAMTNQTHSHSFMSASTATSPQPSSHAGYYQDSRNPFNPFVDLNPNNGGYVPPPGAVSPSSAATGLLSPTFGMSASSPSAQTMGSSYIHPPGHQQEQQNGYIPPPGSR